jgi:transcriptional regulator with XRE-family HTH domain
MIRRGLTNRKIAEECGVGENYVYLTLTGVRTGYRVRRKIAELCKVPVEQLFPNTPAEYRFSAQ